MDAGQVRGVIERRGSIVLWHHARPLDPNKIDHFTQGPDVNLGEPSEPMGNFGERYLEPFPIFAYFSNKIHSSFATEYGIVDQGDAQLTIGVPFDPGVNCELRPLPLELNKAYQEGDFARIQDNGKNLIRYDLFEFPFIPHLHKWMAKAPAIPIVDANQVIAWRILIAKKSV